MPRKASYVPVNLNFADSKNEFGKIESTSQ